MRIAALWCSMLVLIGGAAAVMFQPDVDALVAFYQATNGPNWIDNCGWSTLGQENPCQSNCPYGLWYGVNCTTMPSMQGVTRITQIYLANNNLTSATGVLSPALTQLSALQYLNLSGNTLRAELPPSLGQLYSLNYLILSEAGLSGGIPDSLDNCTELIILDLSYNQFTTVPPLNGQAQLQTLILDGNEMLGTLPPSWGLLTNLVTLSAQGCFLFGNVPASWTGMPNLFSLNLAYNHLLNLSSVFFTMPRLELLYLTGNNMIGSLPESFEGSPALRAINLNENAISGTIPSFQGITALEFFVATGNNITGGGLEQFCSQQNMEVIVLDFNPLGGTIPECIGSLTQLRVVSLADVGLGGIIPESICQLTNLNGLELEINRHMLGPIPDCIGNLTQLTILDLGDNQFEGTIPASMGNLTQLIMLDLSVNNLTGPLPESMGAWQQLQTLSVASNDLNGSLPASIAALKNLILLDLSNNWFDGFFPPWDAHNSSLVQVSFQLNNFTISHDHPLPSFWHVDMGEDGNGNCRAVGTLAYLDLSGIETHREFSAHEVMLLMVDTTLHHECAYVQISSLQALDLSEMNLNDVSSTFFFMVPNLVVLDMSGNHLRSEIPNEYPLPQFMVLLDLSSNDLRGTIPDIFAGAISSSLQHLVLNDNSRLRARLNGCESPVSCLPSFITTDPGNIVEFQTYYCPQLTDSRGRASQITVDATFYNYSLCFCATNYYGAPNGTGTGCQLATSLCPSTNASCIRANSTGYGQVVGFQDGFYPWPSVSSIVTLLPCTPYGVGMPTPCTSSQLKCVMLLNGSLSCAGNLCDVGYYGRLCSECTDEYFLDGNTCVDCRNVPVIRYAWIIPSVVLFFLFAVAVARLTTRAPDAEHHTSSRTFWSIARATITALLSQLGALIILTAANISASWELEVMLCVLVAVALVVVLKEMNRGVAVSAPAFTRKDPMPLVNGLLKSLVVYLQTFNAMGGGAYMSNYAGPAFSARVLNGVECYMPGLKDYFTHFVLYLAMPLIMGGFVLLWLLIRALYLVYLTRCWRAGDVSRRKFDHAVKEQIDRCISAVLLIFNLFFFQSSTRFLSFFTCEKDPTTLVSYNLVYPDVECYDDAKWWLFAGVGIVVFAAYVSVALGVVWRLNRVKGRFRDESVRSAYGFFYEPYASSMWWYDGVVLLRRLGVAILTSVFFNNVLLQGTMLIALLLVCLAAQLKLSPLRYRALNLLEGMSLAVLILSYTCIQFDVLTNRSAGGPTVSVVNVTALIFYLGTMLMVAVTSLAGSVAKRWKFPGKAHVWDFVGYMTAPTDFNGELPENFQAPLGGDEHSFLLSNAARAGMKSRTSTEASAVTVSSAAAGEGGEVARVRISEEVEVIFKDMETAGQHAMVKRLRQAISEQA